MQGTVCRPPNCLGMEPLIASLAALACGLALGSAASADVGFGGAPTLGPRDTLRQALKPYDLVKLNVLGAAYCENLLDCRNNITSYSQLNYDAPWGDGYNLQFPDDSARFMECLAWEDQFSPVVRLELMRRLTKGMIAARVPGSFAESYFRHRSGGKTFLAFGDKQGKEGRFLLSMWGDELSGSLKVGFRIREGGAWRPMGDFAHKAEDDALTDAATARSDRYWHASPITVKRAYSAGAARVQGSARYWLSDEDKPVEYAFQSDAGDGVELTVGEPGCPLPLLGDYRMPTTIHLPDRAVSYRNDRDGDKAFVRPAFRYLILRKHGGSWGTTGYSPALLVMWEGTPERVEVIADKGYGEVRVQYAGRKGRIWLNPYYWLDDNDLEMIHRNAESFLKRGVLLQNGFPTQQMLNALPSGMASGAYLLTKYRDPMAVTARVNAARAVDRLFAAEDEGKTLVRSFFPVKAAAWMAKTATLMKDAALHAHYSRLVDRAVKRMCSPAMGYDGAAWPGGWDHFCSSKALWLAYDATGNPDYLAAYERAVAVYTIDEKGIYRRGVKMEAPGGFDTYSGSLALAVWGHSGKLDYVQKLIDLAVPNGWHQPERLVRDTWNDAGAGPWAQDDANPEYVGLSLKGAALPTAPKVMTAVGAFPGYDARGKVTPRNAPLLHNPYFLPGQAAGRAAKVTSAALLRSAVTRTAGRPLLVRLPLGDAAGAGVDLRIRGDGYRISVSPDGKQWLPRLDTYDPKPAPQSLDLSFLCGSREELVRLEGVTAPDDARLLASPGGTVAAAERRRFTARGGRLVYRIPVAGATTCRLELIVGNGYRVDVSADGRRWRTAASAQDADGGSGKLVADAGMIRMVDATPEAARSGVVYVRLRDAGAAGAFGGRTAFLQRLAVYGALRCRQAWLRVENVSARPGASFTVEGMALRRW